MKRRVRPVDVGERVLLSTIKVQLTYTIYGVALNAHMEEAVDNNRIRTQVSHLNATDLKSCLNT